ncbi:restriction endonuclease subunit S [Campylobacter concisus]|jgi:restriction modification system DNA specificity domain protein|uniref:restriction endonuclease subunit S n=1 Tax=Campylobacter concisus TaxID=199 RepID=UPI000CD879C9|nr:restriction endonuclease subunit S [Campylobacter concisus]MDU2009738.1 restriction endonuclease subunit S [Campylobacter concisus]
MSEFKNLPSGWKVVRLGEISSRVTRRNQDNRCQNVLTISAQSGLINQTDFFNKQVASKDLSNYILLKKGEFAYNKSYSTGYSFGAFKRLKFYEEGVASPLYIYFKFNDDVCSDFFEFYFDAGQANRQIKDIVQEGARNHGLLNLSIDDFFNIKIRMPNLDEQKKIAEILSTWDEAINLTINLIESKKQFKKALMQNLLTAKIRFPQFKGEWKEIKLGNFLEEKSERNTKNIDLILSVTNKFGFVTQVEYFDKSVASDNTANYKIVRKGNFAYNPSRINVGSIALLESYEIGILSPMYVVFECLKNLDNRFLKFWFQSHSFMGNLFKYLAGSVRESLNFNDMKTISIKLPNLKEQQKIVEVLTACDDEINLLNLKLENLKKQKQGLMQKLLSGKVRI